MNMLRLTATISLPGAEGMSRAWKVILVAAAIVLASGLYAAYAWVTKGSAPGSRAWQIQEFRKDLRTCGRFASKREEARKLLAWKPKPSKQESAEIQAEPRNLDAEVKAMLDRRQADETACLQGLDWPDDQIQTLRTEVSETPKNKLLRH
jgi:hypothetical protein